MSNLIERGDAIGACAYETLECYEARNAIRNLPSADRPRGEWMAKNSHTMCCSVCGFEEVAWRTQDYGYCPNCGAKMKGADDE